MKRAKRVEISPSKRLLYSMYVAIGTLVCLVALQITHIIWLGAWSNEIFSAITGLIGTITGVFLSQRA